MNTKDLLLLIGLGILFICPVIGCFGHQEGYSGDNINNKLKWKEYQEVKTTNWK